MAKQKAKTNTGEAGDRKKEPTKNAAKAMKPGKTLVTKSSVDDAFVRRLR